MHGILHAHAQISAAVSMPHKTRPAGCIKDRFTFALFVSFFFPSSLAGQLSIHAMDKRSKLDSLVQWAKKNGFYVLDKCELIYGRFFDEVC
jgi:hypothetical protein